MLILRRKYFPPLFLYPVVDLAMRRPVRRSFGTGGRRGQSLSPKFTTGFTFMQEYDINVSDENTPRSLVVSVRKGLKMIKLLWTIVGLVALFIAFFVFKKPKKRPNENSRKQ